MLNKQILVKTLLIISILLSLLSLSIFILPFFFIQLHLEDYLIYILFALLITGLTSYFADSKKAMYIAFIFSTFMTLYLKTTTNEDFKLPKRNNAFGLKIAEINLNTVEDILFLNPIIRDTSINVIVLLHYTPDWNHLIQPVLAKQFPYQSKLIQLHQHGAALFTKIPILKSDTLMMGEDPVLNTVLSNHTDTLQILSVTATDKINFEGNDINSYMYKDLSNFISMKSRRTIVAGLFNHTYWSTEIVRLKTTLQLKNSRRIIYPVITSAPRDFFFYTNDLECYYFNDFFFKTNIRAGSISGFQIKQHNSGTSLN